MKKAVTVALCFLVLISLFSCKSADDKNDTSVPAISETISEDSKEIYDSETTDTVLSESEKAMEMYNSVLRGAVKVYATDIEEYKYLSNCKYANTKLSDLGTLKYAYTDMDNDGIKELVIDCGDTLVLRYYEGIVYLYRFTLRTLTQSYRFNIDGSYSWSHTGQNLSCGKSKIYFEGAELKEKELYRIVYHEAANEEYYIEGKQVATQEEFWEYFEDYHSKNIEYSLLDAIWINNISENQAVLLAQEYWASHDDYTGDIIVPGANYCAPSYVYVVFKKQYVIDHWTVIDEIWIDKDTGRPIVPFIQDGKD